MRTSAFTFALICLAAITAPNLTAAQDTATPEPSSSDASVATTTVITSTVVPTVIATTSDSVASIVSSAISMASSAVDSAISATSSTQAAAPSSTVDSSTQVKACCGNAINTLELCINNVGVANSNSSVGQAKIFKCACAQGNTFTMDFINCYGCLTSSNTLSQAAMQQLCTAVLNVNQTTLPTPLDQFPVSIFATLTPTGSLSVTTWPGKSAGERVVVQVVSILAVLVGTVVALSL